MLQRHSRVSYVSVVLIIALFIIGCEDTTSNEQTTVQMEDRHGG